MNDYELVYLAQEHIDEAKDLLYKKYLSFIDSFIFRFFNKYGNLVDYDDVRIDCLLVFENVIDKFNQDRDTTFKTYLWTCLDSKLKDIFRSATSKKNSIFINSISLDNDINGVKLVDFVYNNYDLVENKLIDNYIDMDDFFLKIKKKLSNFEYMILCFIIKGYKIEDIALLLEVDSKKIYNTIYRLKFKLKKEFDVYG